MEMSFDDTSVNNSTRCKYTLKIDAYMYTVFSQCMFKASEVDSNHRGTEGLCFYGTVVLLLKMHEYVSLIVVYVYNELNGERCTFSPVLGAESQAWHCCPAHSLPPQLLESPEQFSPVNHFKVLKHCLHVHNKNAILN